MKDEIITYREMCDRENIQTLQRGMNYRLNSNYSVILLSQRKNAPYSDKVYDEGYAIEYEGHDIPKTSEIDNPKDMDQPEVTKLGRLTQNGLFVKAVDDYKKGKSKPEIVRAYEKIFSGVWSEKGFFHLVDYKYVKDHSGRYVYRFILELCSYDVNSAPNGQFVLKTRSRIIPSQVKKEVWKRDKGQCVICGARDELHFDHDLPYSKGGSSITAENVRILCARHNLEKHDKIQ